MEIIACPDFSGVKIFYDIVKAHGGEFKIDSEEVITTALSVVLGLHQIFFGSASIDSVFTFVQ